MGQLFCTAVSPDNTPVHFFLLGVILRMWFTAENLKYFRVKNFIEEVVISITAEMCQILFNVFMKDCKSVLSVVAHLLKNIKKNI